jgi:hypothetical protein
VRSTARSGGKEDAVVWGRSDRRVDDRRPDIDVLLAVAHRTFGDRQQVEALASDRVRVDGLDYVYDRTSEPPFVLVPECDRCGGHDVEQFPLETWTVDGVEIRAQARATCRDCRFLASPTEPSAPVRFAG